MGVTPTPNQAVHILSHCNRVRLVSSWRGGQSEDPGTADPAERSREEAENKQGTASWRTDRAAWEPRPCTHLYLLSSVG